MCVCGTAKPADRGSLEPDVAGHSVNLEALKKGRLLQLVFACSNMEITCIGHQKKKLKSLIAHAPPPVEQTVVLL